MTQTPLTPADDSFFHQAVAPIATTAHADAAWAERCWHLVNLGEGWVLGAGRAAWIHAGRRTAVASLNTGEVQYARRAQEEFVLGDDPDRPDVGPIRIDAIAPLREVRLVLEEESGFGLAFDLTYHARFPPVATERNRIERHGHVVTDYMNFLQSGVYSGVVHARGTERRIVSRAGFRDRGWGLRKHEGASRRGMHVFCGCELPSEALYLLLYETAAGERVLTNGWLIAADGVVETVRSAEHDLRFEGRKLVDGRISVEFESGEGREITAKAEGRLLMEAVGYSAVPGRSDPGAECLDLRDPEVRAEYDGLYDNACQFACAGVSGYGFVEVGLGVHARHRPEG
jgi:hypothetical protein